MIVGSATDQFLDKHKVGVDKDVREAELQKTRQPCNVNYQSSGDRATHAPLSPPRVQLFPMSLIPIHTENKVFSLLHGALAGSPA